MLIQPIQPSQLPSGSGGIDFAGIRLTGTPEGAPDKRYYVSVVDSIGRILTTRIGARVMRPTFGSDLYLLRDRMFNATWRVQATRYIFEALSRFEPRVIFDKVQFNVDAITGKLSFIIHLDPSPKENYLAARFTLRGA